LGFEGGEAVAEVGCRAMEGCAGEVTHRRGGGAESSAYLAVEYVELGVAEEFGLKGEVLPDEESPEDAYSEGLCERGGGKGGY
jgi:hypothetical protein